MLISKYLKTAFLIFAFSFLSAQISPQETKYWQKYRASKDSCEKTELLIAISDKCYQRDRSFSEKIAKQAYELSKKNCSKYIVAKALLRLTNVYFDNGKHPESISLINELLKISAEINDLKVYSEACLLAGKQFHFQGDYDRALEYYLKGLDHFETINDSVQCAEIYNLIGGVYLNQADNKNAFNYFTKSLRIQIQKNDKSRIGRGYLNISNIYIAEKKFDEAKKSLDSGLTNYTRAKFDEGKALVFATLSEIFIAKGQQDSALKYLYEAHNYLKAVNKYYVLTQIDLDIANILNKKNERLKALYYVNDAIEMGLKTKQNHNLAPLYLLKSQLLEKGGDTRAAFENYKLYKAFSDSVLNTKSIKKQTEAALKYDFSKKEYLQKLELQKTAALQQQKENKQKLLLVLLVVIALIVFLVLYYRNFLKQKAAKKLAAAFLSLEQKNKIIEQKTRELQDSLSERELLLKEIHHRVKNNLQIISGLLELQKEELTEESSKAAFDEGQSRVRSISLIHQNLYQNENLGSIQFKTFVKELAEQVKEVFEQLNQQMRVEIDMPEKILDIDTAVPLGLIINELLTNSYKYATVKGKIGKIHIELKEKNNGNYVLSYCDNGPGIKNGINFESATSMGLRLIKGLAGQLAGEASYSNNGASTFTIQFKSTAARQSD